VIGVFPGLVAGLLGAAATAVHGGPVEVKLALWHGINPALLLSVLTFALGIGAYLVRRQVRRLADGLAALGRFGPGRWYEWSLQGMMWVAKTQTRVLQNGYLRYYLLTIVTVTVGLVGYALLGALPAEFAVDFSGLRFHEVLVAATVLAGGVAVACARTRLAAVAALGVVGFGMALLFVIFSAPDLAKTQFSVETLLVVLFVLVVYRLPQFARFSGTASRLRDKVVAGAFGLMMGAIVLVVAGVPAEPLLSPYFAEASVPLAKGRNIVNVILVDFRAIDTLGEIVVLAVAAIGVVALLKLRPRDEASGAETIPAAEEERP